MRKLHPAFNPRRQEELLIDPSPDAGGGGTSLGGCGQVARSLRIQQNFWRLCRVVPLSVIADGRLDVDCDFE